MIKNGAYYYTHQTILSPKDAYGELQEYLGVYISDYLIKNIITIKKMLKI